MHKAVTANADNLLTNRHFDPIAHFIFGIVNRRQLDGLRFRGLDNRTGNRVALAVFGGGGVSQKRSFIQAIARVEVGDMGLFAG